MEDRALKSCALEEAAQVDLRILEARLRDQLELRHQIVAGFDHEGGQMIDVIDRYLCGERSGELDRAAEPCPQPELEVGLEVDPSAEELACAGGLGLAVPQRPDAEVTHEIRRHELVESSAAGRELAAAAAALGPSSASVSRPSLRVPTIEVIAMRWLKRCVRPLKNAARWAAS